MFTRAKNWKMKAFYNMSDSMRYFLGATSLQSICRCFLETKGIIAHQELQKMPRHAILINAARAGLIDQDALTMCLKNGLLAGAGLDDLDLDHPTCQELLNMDKVVVTSHIGFYTQEAIQVKSSICVQNVINFVKK